MFLLFLFQEDFGAFFLNDAHLGLEFFFVGIGQHLVVGRVAAAFEVSLHVGFPFGKVQFVESRLEVVYFVFLRIVVAVCDFLHPFDHLFLAFVHFSLF